MTPPSALRPSLFDRALARVAPRAALRRYEARARFEAAAGFFGGGLLGGGGYDGARSDRPALKRWWPRRLSADAALLPDLGPLRGRSGDLVRNAPLATGALNTQVTSVVGVGVVPHARIDRELTGLSEADADQWERAAETLFGWWAARSCDITRHDTFAGLQRLTLRQVLGDGDLLVVKRYVERPGDLFGTRLQLVEADRVTNPDWRPDTDRLRAGVELDEYGGAVGYWTADRHPGDIPPAAIKSLQWTRVAADGPASGDWRARLVFERRAVGQTRGVPYLAPVIELLKQLTRYSDAELMATVLNSFFTVFVKTEGGDTEGSLEDVGIATGQVEASSAQADARDLNLGMGTIATLSPGEDIVAADPKRPNQNFDPFVQAILRQVGVALEVPFELLIKHFTASYSASQAAILEAWRAVSTRRAWLVDAFCQPAWEAVITEAVARGYLAAPGFFDQPLVRAAYLRTEWTGPTKGSIDPLKDIIAAKERIAATLSTRAQETAQLTGGDWERNFAQLVKESKMMRAAGLNVEPGAEKVVTEADAPAGGRPGAAPPRGGDQSDPEDTADQTEPGEDQEPGEGRGTRHTGGAGARARAVALGGVLRLASGARVRITEAPDGATDLEVLHA